MSSQEPGNWTTPNFTRSAPRSRNPRSADSTTAARTCPEAAADPRRRARSGDRRGRCSPRRTQARAARAPLPGLADRGCRPWAGPGPELSSSPGAAQPLLEGLPGDPLVGLDVLLAGAGNDVVGNRRRRRVAIPAGGGRPVAHELFVEARLRAPWLVPIRRPETRGVRGADLVTERQLAARVEPELELRVGEDDPARASVLGGVLVDSDRDLAQTFG